MCFLADISNSNISNEPEKWSDWERLGISKLKNNPNLKEANEGVPQKCMLEYFTLQNKQAAVPVEFTHYNVPYSAGAGLCRSVSLLSFFPCLLLHLFTLHLIYFLCTTRKPLPHSDGELLLPPSCFFTPIIPNHTLLHSSSFRR